MCWLRHHHLKKKDLESEWFNAFYCYMVLGRHCHSDLLWIQVPTEFTLDLHGEMNLLPQEWFWSRMSWVPRITAECQPFPEQPFLQTPTPLPSTVTVIETTAHCGHRATVSCPSLGSTVFFLPNIKQLSPLSPELQRASLHMVSRQEG